MAKAREQQDLAKAEADIAEADARIEKQRAILDKLTNDGHPTEIAEQLLTTMLDSRHAFEAHRTVICERLGLYPVRARPARPPGSKGRS